MVRVAVRRRRADDEVVGDEDPPEGGGDLPDVVLAPLVRLREAEDGGVHPEAGEGLSPLGRPHGAERVGGDVGRASV